MQRVATKREGVHGSPHSECIYGQLRGTTPGTGAQGLSAFLTKASGKKSCCLLQRVPAIMDGGSTRRMQCHGGHRGPGGLPLPPYSLILLFSVLKPRHRLSAASTPKVAASL